MAEFVEFVARCVAGHTFTVPAWKVDSPVHPDFTFVVHKSLGTDSNWVVSEVTTGMIVATGENSIEAEIAAIERLSLVSADKLRTAVAKGFKRAEEEGHQFGAAVL